MRLRLPSLAAPMLGAAFLGSALIGCGSSSQSNGIANKTPNEIVAGAKILADAASAVHVSGSIVSAGTPIALDMYLVASRGGRGRLSENGVGFEVVQIHGTVYIKGSSALYRHVAGAAAAQLLQGSWLKASANTGSLGPLASLTDLHQLLDTTLAEHGPLAKGAVTTVDGRRVLGLTDTSRGGTLYVAASGPPYPIELTKGGKGGGMIVFDHWNQPVTVIAPANAIDLTQLRTGH